MSRPVSSAMPSTVWGSLSLPLTEMDRRTIDGAAISSRNVLEVLEGSGFILDNDAVMLLATAQVLQDAEIPWG